MHIQTEQRGALTVLKPVGSLIEIDAEALMQQINSWLTDSDTAGGLIVDLSKVTSVDSRGLEVLADVSGMLAKSGRGLRLSAVNKTLREVLSLTDLSDLFEYFEDVTAAAGGEA